MDDDKITLDRETFKALAVDSRVKILRILDDRQHTLSDLAEELQMAPSTIKEHLDTLVAAGLIKQVDKGMKWKYYRLTSKGKELLNPYEKKVWIVLATSLLALAVSAYSIFSRLKDLGKITIIENFNTVAAPMEKSVSDGGMQGAICNTAANATDMFNNATISPDLGVGSATLTEAANRTCEGLSATACDIVQGVANNMTGAASSVSSAMNTVTTTLAETARYAAGTLEPNAMTQNQIIETTAQLPYAEIALFAACALLAGLCIGYLIKRKKRL